MKYYGWIGLALIVFSVINAWQDFSLPPRYFYHGTFEIGYWFFFDALAVMLTGSSIISKARKLSFKEAARFLAPVVFVGFVFGLLCDLYAMNVLRGFWEYPAFDGIQPSWLRMPVMSLAWVIWAFMMIESYRVFRALLGNTKSPRMKRLESDPGEGFFIALWLLALLIHIPIFLLYIFSPIRPPPFWILVLAELGGWLLFEAIAFYRGKTPFITLFFRKDWKSILGVLLAFAFCCLTWETMNAPIQSWVYYFSWTGPHILGVPLGLYVLWGGLGGPLTMALYNAFLPKKHALW